MNRSLRSQTPDRHPMSRLPLFPLGTTANYQPYQPIYEVPKKLSSFANILPSYQQRLMQRQAQSRVKMPKEEVQRQLIASNQAEVEGQNRRRRLLQQSYMREIERLQIILSKNSERKEKLKSQIELLQKDSNQLKIKVQDAQNSLPQKQLPEGLQKKHLQIIELKGQMVNRIRDRQQSLLKEKQDQDSIWQQRLKQKQNALMIAQQQRNAARNQLLKVKRQSQTQARIVPSSVSDIARGRKYQQFKYDFDVLKQKISLLNEQRISSTRQVQQTKHLKTTIIKDQGFKIEQLKRNKVGIEQNLKQIQLRNKQLQKTNVNLLQQTTRKQNLIIQYQSDIQQSKLICETNDAQINSKLNEFRNRQVQQILTGLSQQIENVHRRIREIQADTFRLRGDFKKLGEFLESEVTKSIYNTFNTIKSA